MKRKRRRREEQGEEVKEDKEGSGVGRERVMESREGREQKNQHVPIPILLQLLP